MVSFIDSIVAEYQRCQWRLGETPKPPLPPVVSKVKSVAFEAIAKEPERAPKRKKGEHVVTLRKGMHKMLEKLVFLGKYDLSIALQPEKQPKASTVTEPIEEPIFVRTLPISLWKTAGTFLDLFLQNLTPQASSKNEIERIALLGETLVHSMMCADYGLHLVIAPQNIIPEMGEILLKESLAWGVKTAWELKLPKSPSNEHFDQITRLFESAQYPVSNWTWIEAILSLWSFFPAEECPFNRKVVNKPFLTHLKTFVARHLEVIDHYVYSDDDWFISEIEMAVNQAMKCLVKFGYETEPNFTSTMKQRCERVLAVAEQGESLEALYGPIRDCFEITPHIRNREEWRVIQAQFVLAARILSIDPRMWGIQNGGEDYPPPEQYERLLHFSPKQFHSHSIPYPLPQGLFSGAISKNLLLVTTPDSLSNASLGAIAPYPLRSLHLFGYEKSDPATWKLILKVAEELMASSKQLYPQEPHALVARYVETQDPRLHGQAWTKVE